MAVYLVGVDSVARQKVVLYQIGPFVSKEILKVSLAQWGFSQTRDSNDLYGFYTERIPQCAFGEFSEGVLEKEIPVTSPEDFVRILFPKPQPRQS